MTMISGTHKFIYATSGRCATVAIQNALSKVEGLRWFDPAKKQESIGGSIIIICQWMKFRDGLMQICGCRSLSFLLLETHSLESLVVLDSGKRSGAFLIPKN
jgi:hypothetical protein